MNKNIFNTSYAIELDKNSSMYNHSKLFHYPVKKNKKILYFNGNSLGLQPKGVQQSVFKELDDWKNLGSIGYFKNWVTYHETLNKLSSLIVGAKPSEIMIMNALTVNIHLLLISFYKHTKTRYKILIEKDIFPSDRYAIASHLKMKKLNPSKVIEEINANNHYIETDAILKKIEGPIADDSKVSQFLITSLDYDSYVGQVAIGRLNNGTLEMNESYALCSENNILHNQKFSTLYTFDGLDKVKVEKLEAGDIIANSISHGCLLYTSPSPRDKRQSRMPASA